MRSREVVMRSQSRSGLNGGRLPTRDLPIRNTAQDQEAFHAPPVIALAEVISSPRRIALEVTSLQAAAACTDLIGSYKLPVLTQEVREAFVTSLRQNYADLPPVHWFPRKRSALGVFVRDADCTIESLRIEAMGIDLNPNKKE